MENMKDWFDQNGERPVYVLAGENDFERLVRGRAIRRHYDGRDVERFDANEPAAALVESADTLSLFGAGKVLWQDNPAWLVKGELPDELVSWVEDPTADALIVLTLDRKPDRRRKNVKWFEKKGFLIPCVDPKPWELPRWIQSRFAARGKRIDASAAEALQALVGDSQMMLEGEVEKLCLYAGDQKALGLAEVEALAAASAQAHIFRFIDELFCGHGTNCLNQLDGLLNMKEPEVKINFMIARQLRILLQGKMLLLSGVPDSAIAKRMGVNPYVWKKARPHVHSCSVESLERYLLQAHRLDLDLKSGRGEGRVLLESFILDFCRRDAS